MSLSALNASVGGAPLPAEHPRDPSGRSAGGFAIRRDRQRARRRRSSPRRARRRSERRRAEPKRRAAARIARDRRGARGARPRRARFVDHRRRGRFADRRRRAAPRFEGTRRGRRRQSIDRRFGRRDAGAGGARRRRREPRSRGTPHRRARFAGGATSRLRFELGRRRRRAVAGLEGRGRVGELRSGDRRPRRFAADDHSPKRRRRRLRAGGPRQRPADDSNRGERRSLSRHQRDTNPHIPRNRQRRAKRGEEPDFPLAGALRRDGLGRARRGGVRCRRRRRRGADAPRHAVGQAVDAGPQGIA